MAIYDTASCLVCRQVAWVPRSWCPGFSTDVCVSVSETGSPGLWGPWA